VLKRGQLASLETRERLTLPMRIRATVKGLAEPWADKFLQLSGKVLHEPPTNDAPLNFGLINQGPYDLTLTEGDPILVVTFDYLAHEPVALS
jgi:hypothetical protein